MSINRGCPEVVQKLKSREGNSKNTNGYQPLFYGVLHEALEW